MAVAIVIQKRKYGNIRNNIKTMNGCNKKQYRPTVDETKVPCSMYMSTDCIYPGDKVRVESLGLSPSCDMSDVLNAMIKAIRDRDAEILELRRMINKLI